MAIPLKYNFRSLLVRRASTLMTVVSIALVVAVFVAVVALANGLETSLVATGHPLNVLALRVGSQSETQSTIPHEALPIIRYYPGVQNAADGEPLVSGEITVLINLVKRESLLGSNVLIRGLSKSGLELRPQVRIVEGRMFQPGQREVIVSRSISKRFKSTALHDTLRFGKGAWTVVGLFEAGRTAFDSEIWADVNQIANDYNRTAYSSILVRAVSPAAARELKNKISGDQRLRLSGHQELDYYAEQTKAAGPIKFLGLLMAVSMAVGACFAAMNTMYAAVIYRTREIATMRVLGFKRGSILFSFLTESLLIALIGGVFGCILALPINGLSTGTTNFRTFSEVTFDFRVTPGVLLDGMLFATALGLLGGFLPAHQAARQGMVAALRA